MFVRQNQNQFRNSNADVQLFYKSSNWLKPVGVSHVYMMLIGGGGNNSGSGGSSGAVTVWYGATQNVPDNLRISVSTGDSSNTTVSYVGTSTTTLLTANGAVIATNGSAMTANQFANSGFFQSVAGQAWVNGGQSASSTTFLSTGTSASPNNANYGYTTFNNGYFQLQPIIVGVGTASATGTDNVYAAIGCGAGSGANGKGGPGLVLIASW